MKIFEIKNLDCTKKEHRKILLQAVMKACKFEEKPSIEELQEICKKIKKKYNIKLRTFKRENTGFDCDMASIEVESGQYVTFDFYNKYECLCKYILLVRAYVKYQGRCNDFRKKA